MIMAAATGEAVIHRSYFQRLLQAVRQQGLSGYLHGFAASQDLRAGSRSRPRRSADRSALSSAGNRANDRAQRLVPDIRKPADEAAPKPSAKARNAGSDTLLSDAASYVRVCGNNGTRPPANAIPTISAATWVCPHLCCPLTITDSRCSGRAAQAERCLASASSDYLSHLFDPITQSRSVG